MTKVDALIGTVVRKEGAYWVVECPDAPIDHLQIHFLIDRQIGAACIGERVELTYRVTPSYTEWFVSNIL